MLAYFCWQDCTPRSDTQRLRSGFGWDEMHLQCGRQNVGRPLHEWSHIICRKVDFPLHCSFFLYLLRRHPLYFVVCFFISLPPFFNHFFFFSCLFFFLRSLSYTILQIHHRKKRPLPNFLYNFLPPKHRSNFHSDWDSWRHLLKLLNADLQSALRCMELLMTLKVVLISLCDVIMTLLAAQRRLSPYTVTHGNINDKARVWMGGAKYLFSLTIHELCYLESIAIGNQSFACSGCARNDWLYWQRRSAVCDKSRRPGISCVDKTCVHLHGFSKQRSLITIAPNRFFSNMPWAFSRQLCGTWSTSSA